MSINEIRRFCLFLSASLLISAGTVFAQADHDGGAYEIEYGVDINDQDIAAPTDDAPVIPVIHIDHPAPAHRAAPAASVASNGLPRIAVYVTGNVPDDEKTALGTRMLASLVNSGRYRGIERSTQFLAEIEREQIHQRGGAVDDAQISALGRQFGIRYICVAAITPAFGAFQVSARIVDVETAEVVFIGESYSSLETTDDLTKVSDEVVRIMFGEAAPEPPPAVYIPAPMHEPQQHHSRFRLVIRLSTGALAVGGVVGGIVLDGMMTNEHEKYRASSHVPTIEETRRNAENYQMTRNALYILAGIGLSGLAVTFLF